MELTERGKRVKQMVEAQRASAQGMAKTSGGTGNRADGLTERGQRIKSLVEQYRSGNRISENQNEAYEPYYRLQRTVKSNDSIGKQQQQKSAEAAQKEAERIAGLDMESLQRIREIYTENRNRIEQEKLQYDTISQQEQIDGLIRKQELNQQQLDEVNRDIYARERYEKGLEYQRIYETRKEDAYLPGLKDRTYQLVNGTWTNLKENLYSGMEEAERQIYNTIVAQQGLTKGEEYLEWLKPELNRRYAAQMHERLADTANAHPIAGTMMNVGAGLWKPLGYGYTAVQNIANRVNNEYQLIDPNAGWFAPNIASEATTEGLTRDMSDAGKFLTQTGLSIAQNLFFMGFGEATSLALMGLGSASDTSREILQRGGSNEQAAWGGAAAGAAEVLFEKVSLDSLIRLKDTDNLRDAVGNILKQAGVEASEEAFTELTNNLSDQLINGGLSNYQQAVQRYMAQGMEEAEAKKAASAEIAGEIGLAALGGALSGGVLAGGKTVMQYNGGQQDILQERERENRALQEDARARYEAAKKQVEAAQASAQAQDTAAAQQSKTGEAAGRTEVTYRADGARTEATGIDRIEANGKTYVKTADGNTTALEELSFAEERMGMLYENAELFGTEGGRAYVSGYDGRDIGIYTNGWAGVYNRAANGSSEAAAVKYGKEAGLSEAQALSAYYSGHNSYAAGESKNAKKYAIKYGAKNTPYVDIEEDILQNVPRKEWVKTVKNTLREKFPDGIEVGNNTIKINKKTVREMTFSKYMQWALRNDTEAYADKLRATNNTDEILRASGDYVNEALLHPRKDNIQEFARGRVLLSVGQNSYEASVIVGKTFDGELLLYDIINLKKTSIMKKADAHTEDRDNAQTQQKGASANNRITQGENTVNPNIRQKGKKDTALRKEKFAGETKRLVHHYSGTLTAEQQDTLRILDIAAQVLDRTVYIEDSIDGEIAGQRAERGANAYFDPRDNSYHLALDATQQGYLTIMLHEAVHDIAANNRAGYEQLAEVVMKYLQEEKAQEQVREDILRYEQRGYREAEEIEEELVANAVGVILNDRRTAEEFAKRFLARDTKARKAFMRILDNLREYLKRTIAAIKGEADFRQTELLEKRAGAIEEIRQAMFDAMEGLRSGFSSAQVTGIKLSEKNTYPYDMQKVIEEYLGSINHEILEYVNAVKEDSNTDYRRIKVCDVNEKQATDLKRLTGKDFSGYQNAIDKSAISHIEKRHGMDGIADSSMRNAEDIARIGYILQNYDSAELTIELDGNEKYSKGFMDKNNKPVQMLRFSKKINGTYYAVIACPEARWKKLWVVTAYIGNKKSSQVTQALDAETPSTTSETPLASPMATDNSITQNENAVNPSIRENAGNDAKEYSEKGSAGKKKYSLKEATIPTQEELEKKEALQVVDISEAQTTGSFRERRKQILDKAQEIIQRPYLNKDTDTYIFLTEKSYTHAFSNPGKLNINAAEHLSELIENAVLTHAEVPTHGNKYANGVYTFFAAVRTNEVFPVKIKVKEYWFDKGNMPQNIRNYLSQQNTALYSSIYDTAVLEVQEIEESSTGSAEIGNITVAAVSPEELSNIKIAELQKLVKGEARRYLPQYQEGEYKKKYSLKTTEAAVIIQPNDEQQAEQLEKLRSTLDRQYRLKAGRQMTREAAEKLAGRAIRRFHSGYAAEKLAADLQTIFDEAGRNFDADIFLAEGARAMKGVLAESSTFDKATYAQYAPVRELLKQKMTLTETQKEEAAAIFGSYGEYRRQLFGSTSLGPGGTSLDIAWQELHRLAPELFPAESSEGDMVSALYDAVQAVKKENFYVNEFAMNLDEAATVAFADLYAEYADLTPIKMLARQMEFYAKRYARESEREAGQRQRLRQEKEKRDYEALKQKRKEEQKKITRWEAQRKAELREQNSRIRALQAQKQEAMGGMQRYALDAEITRLEDVKAEIDARYDRMIRNERTLLEEMGKALEKAAGSSTRLAADARQQMLYGKTAAKMAENRQKQAATRKRQAVRRKIGALMHTISAGTDAKHIPEALRNTVAEFLQKIDPGFREDSKAAWKWREQTAVLAARMEEYNLSGGQMQVDAYIIAQLRTIGEDIAARIQTAGSSIREMKLTELQKLDETLDLLGAAIRNSDRILAEERSTRLAAVAQQSMEELRQRKAYQGRMKGMNELLNLQQLDAFSFAEKLGPAFQNSIFKNLRSGLDHKIQMLQEASAAMEQAAEQLPGKRMRDKLKALSGEQANTTIFTLESGTQIRLTTGQIMELYLLNQREAGRRHIYRGGITVEEYTAGRRKVKKQSRKQVSEADIDAITETLTPAQKRFAEMLQHFCATTGSEWGNRVSLSLWGIKKFTDQRYWPIRVDNNTLETNTMPVDASSIARLKNIGMSQSTNPGADNALILGDVIDTYIRHMDDMTSYAAYVLPLEDAQRWLNYHGEDGATMKESVEKALGKGGVDYLEDFLETLNGGKRKGDSAPNWYNRLMRNYKIAAVAANLRVVIQQPSAYARAAAEIAPKYLLHAGKSRAQQESGMRMAQRYAPIFAWKQWGFRDTFVAGDLRSIMVGDRSFYEQIIQQSGALAGLADDMTWGALWNACAAEIRDTTTLEEGTEAFNRRVGERFGEVIDKTQVVDSPFHRSMGMRSGNNIWKTLTAFMSEPIKSYNMLYRALADLRQSGWKDKAAWQRAVRSGTAFAAQNIINSLLAAVIDVFRDDDRDETLAEKYFGHTLENFLEGINPLETIPLAGDLLESLAPMLEGENPDFSNFQSDLGYEGLANLLTAAYDLYNSLGDYKKNDYYAIYKLISALGQVTGIPIGNAWRMVNSILQTAGVEISPYTKLATPYTAAEHAIKEIEVGRSGQATVDAYAEAKGAEMLETQPEKYTDIQSAQNFAGNEVYRAMAILLSRENEAIPLTYAARERADTAEVDRIRAELTAKGYPAEVVDEAILIYASDMQEQKTYGEKEYQAQFYHTRHLEKAIDGGNLQDIRNIRAELIRDSTAQDPTATVDQAGLSYVKQQYLQAYESGASTQGLKRIATEIFGATEEQLQNWLLDDRSGDFYTALEAYDTTAANRSIAQLKELGREEKSITTSVTRKYREKLLQAYQSGEMGTVNRLMDLLHGLALYDFRTGEPYYSYERMWGWLEAEA